MSGLMCSLFATLILTGAIHSEEYTVDDNLAEDDIYNYYAKYQRSSMWLSYTSLLHSFFFICVNDVSGKTKMLDLP